MDKVFSRQTQREYEPGKSVVRIVDRTQQALYLKYNATILDIYYSDGEIVMVFAVSDTKELYKLWRAEQLV